MPTDGAPSKHKDGAEGPTKGFHTCRRGERKDLGKIVEIERGRGREAGMKEWIKPLGRSQVKPPGTVLARLGNENWRGHAQHEPGGSLQNRGNLCLNAAKTQALGWGRAGGDSHENRREFGDQATQNANVAFASATPYPLNPRLLQRHVHEVVRTCRNTELAPLTRLTPRRTRRRGRRGERERERKIDEPCS